MVDYTWIANLLKEIEVFAKDNKLAGLCENVTLACAALISDTEDKAKIDPTLRGWLEIAAAGQVEHCKISNENIIDFPRC